MYIVGSGKIGRRRPIFCRPSPFDMQVAYISGLSARVSQVNVDSGLWYPLQEALKIVDGTQLYGVPKGSKVYFSARAQTFCARAHVCALAQHVCGLAQTL